MRTRLSALYSSGSESNHQFLSDTPSTSTSASVKGINCPGQVARHHRIGWPASIINFTLSNVDFTSLPPQLRPALYLPLPFSPMANASRVFCDVVLYFLFVFLLSSLLGTTTTNSFLSPRPQIKRATLERSAATLVNAKSVDEDEAKRALEGIIPPRPR